MFNLKTISKFACLLIGALLTIATSSLIQPANVYATSISLLPATGSPGSRITLNGEGFIGKLATIYWDDKKFISNVPITQSGQITYSFEVPPSSKGQHAIKVTDDSNWSNITASATLIVTPSIIVDPVWGRALTPVTVFGSGFMPGETNIKTTWDGKTLSRSPISADKTGSWSSNFEVPSVSKGEYKLSAYGEVTKTGELTDIVFTVAPFCKANPLSGPVGTGILLTGVGFRSGEDGLTFTWDGTIFDMNYVAEPNGTFKYTIAAPPSVKGRHILGTYGSSFTPRGIVPDIEFEITPSIKLDPVSGNKGTTVKLEGSGFNASETISLMFDNSSMGVTANTDNAGSFSTTFKIPSSTGKDHQVSAKGSKGAIAQSVFTTSIITPTVPQLLFPGPGARIHYYTSLTDVILGTPRLIAGFVSPSMVQGQKSDGSTLTKMNWSTTGDQSGITVALQISSSEDFKTPIFQKTGIAGSVYELSKSSLPMSGSFYWRVKAIHETGGESAWSNPWKFEIQPASPLVIALTILVVILIIGLLIFGTMAVISLVRNRA